VGSITENSFAKVDYQKQDFPMSPSWATLDGDGEPDLVVGNGSNSVAVLRNTGGETEAPTFTVPPVLLSMLIANCVYDTSLAITGDVANESDNCSTGLTQLMLMAIADGPCQGTRIITRTWSLVDHSGNAAANQVQTITISDNTAPSLQTVLPL